MAEVAAALEHLASASLARACGDRHAALEAVRDMASATMQQAAAMQQAARGGGAGREPLAFPAWVEPEGQLLAVAEARDGGAEGKSGMEGLGWALAGNPLLLDSLPAKLSALVTGVDAACMLLRIDGALLAGTGAGGGG
jgi:hypothetical protein